MFLYYLHRKEVIFLPRSVCLTVCLSTTLLKKSWTDTDEIFSEGWSVAQETIDWILVAIRMTNRIHDSWMRITIRIPDFLKDWLQFLQKQTRQWVAMVWTLWVLSYPRRGYHLVTFCLSAPCTSTLTYLLTYYLCNERLETWTLKERDWLRAFEMKCLRRLLNVYKVQQKIKNTDIMKRTGTNTNIVQRIIERKLKLLRSHMQDARRQAPKASCFRPNG